MIGHMSQRKVAGGERELCSLLRAHGYDVKRGGSLTFGEVPDLMGLPGIHIECKKPSGSISGPQWIRRGGTQPSSKTEHPPSFIYQTVSRGW